MTLISLVKDAFFPKHEGDTKNGIGTITYPNGDVYRGQFKDSKLEGTGTVILADGTAYIGEFKNGDLNGEGRVHHPDGNMYIGNFKNSKPNGKCYILTKLVLKVLHEGRPHQIMMTQFKECPLEYRPHIRGWHEIVYSGTMQEGALNGPGKLWPYDVVFKNFVIDGPSSATGAIAYPKDNKWEKGQFFNGELCGEGERVKGSSAEKGNFSRGKLEGRGMRQKGGVLEEGIFKEGTLHKGKMTYPTFVEEGKFSYTRFIKGTRTFTDGKVEKVSSYGSTTKRTHPNGDIEEGSFYADQLSRGTKTFVQGVIASEEGFFSRGALNGSGTRTFRDGSKEKGAFKAGKLDGPGEKTTKDGVIEVGHYSNGSFLYDFILESGEKKGSLSYMKAKKMFASGEIAYEEGYFDNDKLDGEEGLRVYVDGREERGAFEYGKLGGGSHHFSRSNYCKRTGKDGSFEEGDFNNGSLRKGKRVLADGPIHKEEGEFLNGKLQKEGFRAHRDGTLEIGHFEEGSLFGQGKTVFPDGRVQEGIYPVGPLTEYRWEYENSENEDGPIVERGLLTGAGKRIFTNGLIASEAGNFDNGLLKGEGERNFRDGGVEKGTFSKGYLANGKRTFSQGDLLYEMGEFKHGNLATGHRAYRDGSFEYGPFQEGALFGQGRKVGPDGTVRAGCFPNGPFVEFRWEYEKRKEQKWPEVDHGPMTGIGKKIFLGNGPIASEEGTFFDDRLLSKSKRTYRDGRVEEGDFYEGDFHEGTRTFATGTVEKEKGTFFKGYLRDGERINRDGKKEEGAFHFGQLLLPASKYLNKIHSLSGYEGTWNGQELNGPGKIRNWSSYSSYYRDVVFDHYVVDLDKREAKGKIERSCGVVEEGHFKEDLLILGKRTFETGAVASEEGSFVGDRWKDKWAFLTEGKIVFRDGSYEEGKFQDGLLLGDNCKKTFAEGKIAQEEGSFWSGQLHGKGKRTFSDGTTEEGSFLAGVLDERGKRTFPDGSIEEGLPGGIVKKTSRDGSISCKEFKNGQLSATWHLVDVKFSPYFLEGIAVKEYHSGPIAFDEGEFFSSNLYVGKRTYRDGKEEEGKFFSADLFSVYLNNYGGFTRGARREADGTVEKGEFSREGKLHGQGVRVLKDGAREEGRFLFGIKV